MLMRLLMGSPPDDGFDSLDYLKYSEKLAKENSVISASKVIHPMVNTNSGEQKIFTSQYYFPFKMMETKFDADEISWQRDILNRKQNFNAKQKAIIEAMSHSWKGYKYYAWGYDTLQPISKSGHNWFNVGLTIIDSLDTLLLMGMEKEFYDALEWIQKDLNFYQNNDVNCFEMTIRVLGGLLSAYHLTKSSDILFKAADIGDRLIHCYDSPSKVVPFSDVNLRSKLPHSPTWAPESSTSEVSTIQLEFRDLSRIIKQPIYETASFRTSEHIHNLTALDPLVPMYINPINGRFTISTITLGARSDSYYEYLFKQYLQTSKLWLREDFLRAMKAVKERLTQTTPKELKLQFIGEISPKDSMFIPKMDHLVCFMPGLLALANYHLSTEPNYRENESFRKQVDELMPWSQSLARTCYLMYNLTATGLAPEIAYFNLDKDDPSDEYLIRPRDTHNLLRPEYVESLFYLYQITKDEKYRTQGWEVSIKTWQLIFAHIFLKHFSLFLSSSDI